MKNELLIEKLYETIELVYNSEVNIVDDSTESCIGEIPLFEVESVNVMTGFNPDWAYLTRNGFNSLEEWKAYFDRNDYEETPAFVNEDNFEIISMLEKTVYNVSRKLRLATDSLTCEGCGNTMHELYVGEGNYACFEEECTNSVL